MLNPLRQIIKNLFKTETIPTHGEILVNTIKVALHHEIKPPALVAVYRGAQGARLWTFPPKHRLESKL